MERLNISMDTIKQRFRYSIRQLLNFEAEESVKKQKCHLAMILIAGFIIYSIITLYPCIESGYFHGAVVNLFIVLVFVLMAIHLKLFKNHIATTMLGSFELIIILFFHFITETDWTIGMDAFWLFILIMPFLTDYIAGVIYGTIAASSGLILSLVCFYTPVINYLQPYGQNMIQWYPVIYTVVMVVSAVIEYELTAYQIDRRIADEKISFYQEDRNKRLEKLLDIYEANAMTIRKYRHDIRHFNRVLAGFIQNGEYEKASNYLNDFDNLLENVTEMSFCDNSIVNELLSLYAARSQKMKFKMRVKANVPEPFPMEPTDLTSLVANALENAFEAQEHLDVQKRSVQVEINYDGRKLRLQTKNPCGIDTSFNENGLPISTRDVQSGIGTARIKSIAEKYGGVASFSQEKDIFIVKAVMTCM